MKFLKTKQKEDKAINKLFTASKTGDLVALKKAIKKYPDIIDCTDVDMLSPLNYSIINGHTEIALYLLDKGASIYLTDCMIANNI